MIHLITGLPGNGKTLYAISYIKNLSEKEGRPVFYSGIKDLTLPWVEHDPEKWFELAPNSIMVIDECQRVFRPRGSGSKVPEYVAQLETHRHQGIDLYLITQHPMLVDANIRRLVNNHKHVVRPFGLQRATIHEWSECQENTKSRASSNKHIWSYPKEAFNWYKSAEVHTVKRSIPKRVWMLLLIIFIVPLLIWLAFSKLGSITDKHEQPKEKTEKSNQSTQSKSSNTQSNQQVRSYDRETQSFIESRRPELAGLPFTAAAYSEITKPKRAPIPAACMQSKTKCNCYTQDGTKIPDVPLPTCQSIVENGFFVDWQEEKQQHVPLAQATPIQTTVEPSYSPRVGSLASPVEDAPKRLSNESTDGQGGRGKALPRPPA